MLCSSVSQPRYNFSCNQNITFENELIIVEGNIYHIFLL